MNMPLYLNTLHLRHAYKLEVMLSLATYSGLSKMAVVLQTTFQIHILNKVRMVCVLYN